MLGGSHTRGRNLVRACLEASHGFYVDGYHGSDFTPLVLTAIIQLA